MISNVSASLKLSIACVNSEAEFLQHEINSASTASLTFGLHTSPAKYLLLIAMVRFTKLPSVFAKSEL